MLVAADEAGAITRRIFEAFNRRSLCNATCHIADDAEFVLVPTGQRYRGPAGFQAMAEEAIVGSFDLTVTLMNQIVSDSQVANQLVIRGSHDGPVALPDRVLAPTGRMVEYAVAEIVRLRGDKVADLYSYFDSRAITRQLMAEEGDV